MNLHNVVRGQIPVVNPDIAGVWRRSAGSTTAADGTRTSLFTDTLVQLQVQAVSARDVWQLSNLNIQGVSRVAYMYGNPQGVVRVDVKGGDLLLFPQVLDGPVQTWLVAAVLETWAPDAVGWGKVALSLQVDQ